MKPDERRIAATTRRYSEQQLFAAIREGVEGEEAVAALDELQGRWEALEDAFLIGHVHDALEADRRV